MIYINTENGSHKFWGYSSQQKIGKPFMEKAWTVTTYWGRIGQSLETCQRKEFEFDAEWQAERFIEEKLQDKKNKGYRPIQGSYEDMIEGKDVKIAGEPPQVVVTTSDIDVY